MSYTGQISGRQRILSGSGTLFLVLAVGLGLASGLDLSVVRRASEAISAIAMPLPPVPEQVAPSQAQSDKASGKASAANKQAKAAAIAAPPPRLPPVVPPVAAAPRPGVGTDVSSGATPTPGPGSGAGGRGDGTGAGGAGTGSGTGGGTKAAWRSGTIRDRDYPRDASRAKAGGEVEVRFTIEASGRVSGCRVSRSSGDASLDQATCTLIEDRFRFKPATNPAGEAIASQYGWRQRWWIERRP